jgi:hypothetical protein
MAGIEPCNHIFKKQALNNRLCKVKQVIYGENGLNEIVFPRRKGFRRRVYFKGFAVHPNAKAIQRHPQEILPLLRVEIVPGRLKIVNSITIIGQNVAAVFRARVDL